jgi:hypothetical protein
MVCPWQSSVTLLAAIVKHEPSLETSWVRVYTVFGEFRVPHVLIVSAKIGEIANKDKKKTMYRNLKMPEVFE